MSTTTVKTIGSGGGRDYSTVQAWEDAAPANLTTSIAGGEIWQGQCYADSEFTSGSTLLTISGSTTDATGYKHLTTGPGQSFADHANKLTNALKYNAANGVGLRTTADYTKVIIISEAFTVIEKLQLSGRYQRTVEGTKGCTIKGCIIEGSNGAANVVDIANPGSAVKIINNLILHHSSGSSNKTLSITYPAAGTLASSNTIVKTGTLANGSGIFTSGAGSTNFLLTNNAVFGFGATPFSGTFSASSDYNATDHSAATGGAHDLVSLTYADQFQNTTDASRDYRTVDTGSLDTAGVRDATNTGDLDIVGQARSTTTPTIGAWEVAAAGGGGTAVPVFRRHYQTMQVR